MVPYRLIDFGSGKKLESLGDYLIIRPSPAAQGTVANAPAQWELASAHYVGAIGSAGGQWEFHYPWPDSIEVACGSFKMPIAPTPQGHIGLFPEQQSQWSWLQDQIAKSNRSPQVLNLFAYTGASTIAMAKKGATVVHVDASKPSVQKARAAAELNGLAHATIRYLVEDVPRFVAREVRRQRQYDLIVLDPPAYGHGPNGETWYIDRDLHPLLQSCHDLLAPRAALLLTGHSDAPDEPTIVRWIQMLDATWRIDCGRSGIADADGRTLDAGFYIRATRS
jgi:23S rRNA (cytosine1962-C5)-methyltransferase